MKKNMKVMGSAPGEKQISVSRVGSGEVRGSSGSAATQNIFQPSQINVSAILRKFTRKC